jgi:hypothetical protein
MATCEEEFDEDQRGAAGDRGIGHVEGPEVPRALVHIDEVDDVTKPHAVNQVPDRAAKDE